MAAVDQAEPVPAASAMRAALAILTAPDRRAAQDACDAARRRLSPSALDDALTALIGRWSFGENPAPALGIALARHILRDSSRAGAAMDAAGAPTSPLITWVIHAWRDLSDPALDASADDRIASATRFLAALDVRSEPGLYALVAYPLGVALQEKVEAGDSGAFADAVAAFQQVVDALTDNNVPGVGTQRAASLQAAAQQVAQSSGIASEAPQPRRVAPRQDAMRELLARAEHNLGWLYLAHTSSDRAADLETAREWLLRARELLDPRAEESVRIHMLLGDIYVKRIRDERLANLDEACWHFWRALRLARHGHDLARIPEIRHNLAHAYRLRLSGQPSRNLEKAVRLGQLAHDYYVNLRNRPRDQANTASELATAYYERILGSREDNLLQAIKLYREALELYTRERRGRESARVEGDLANALGELAELPGQDRTRLLQDAVELYQQALATRDRSADGVGDADPLAWADSQNNLGVTYAALAAQWPRPNAHLADDALSAALEVLTPKTMPASCRRAALNLGELRLSQGQWREALEAYRVGLAASEQLYGAALGRAGKEAELADTSRLHRGAAYASARLGPEGCRDALLLAETGRARLLSEALGQGEAELARLRVANPAAAAAYTEATSLLGFLEPTRRGERLAGDVREAPPSLVAANEQARQARDALQRALADIRAIEGFERFLLPPTWEDVVQALPVLDLGHPPLVYLLPTSAGTLALLAYVLSVGSAPVLEPIWIADFGDRELRRLLYGSRESGDTTGWLAAYGSQGGGRRRWMAAIETTTRALWPLMGPVVTTLVAAGFRRADLVPGGLLGMLPLHAAWCEDETVPAGRDIAPWSGFSGKRYALDEVAFAYAPNTRALRQARAAIGEVAPQRMLAIGDPSGTLRFALAEEALVGARFPGQVTRLDGDAATVAAFSELAPGQQVLHFATHGQTGWWEALDGRLVMAGKESLTLATLLRQRLDGARLAVLSACETGIPGFRAPDEAVALPSGMLQAGVCGVIASLWPVDDLSTALLMARFYELWPVAVPDPAEALRQAQIWMRDTSVDDKVAAFRYNASEEIESLVRQLTWHRHRQYAHMTPYYWGAFTLTGA